MSDKGKISAKFDEQEALIKAKIEDIINKITNTIKLEEDFLSLLITVDSVYSPVKDKGEDISKNEIKNIKVFQGTLQREKTKLENIRKKLNDEHIKVALFGDVSAGKSQMINSILGRKIFIPAYCHTTICFVRISLGETFEMLELPDVPEPIICNTEDKLRVTVKSFANFNGEKKLKPNEILKIKINKKEKDVIMREKLTLIDCPGGNDSQEVTDMIENVVLEADIFLYILTQVIFEQQRVFFNKLLTKTSAPNIFVLVNKWDETDDDDPKDTEKAFKTLHSEIAEWLVEMDSDNKDLCNKRIFFVSAQETLQEKMGEPFEKENDQRNKRLLAFKEFEKVFGEHLDNPKEIKFEKHIKEFDKMDENVKKIKEDCGGRLEILKKKRTDDFELVKKKMEELENVRNHLCSDTEEKLKNINSEEFYKFSNEQLKFIEKELGKFMDVIAAPEPSFFKKIGKSMWSYTSWILGDTSDPVTTFKVDTYESTLKYIEREVELIKTPLQKEYDVYMKHIEAFPSL